LRSILDMAAAASGDERIPCSTHPKPQSNILSQEYLFQSTKNSKGCKACVARCLIFSTVEWTKEHPCNMKRASEQAWERERFTLQIRHQFGVVLTMTSPTHLIPYPKSTTSIHPRCNLLFFLLQIPQPNCTRIPWKISGKGRTGFNSTRWMLFLCLWCSKIICIV
jgi:hypothetical protein